LSVFQNLPALNPQLSSLDLFSEFPDKLVDLLAGGGDSVLEHPQYLTKKPGVFDEGSKFRITE
jgi:hypothetical protein